ncbi:bark storage protein A-like [Cryptomeria japonica]|uniref:bark storage protein A-like n=1 Tax=Cryptomeria japonica TaxID=3369 RepID=UPI0027D9EC4C|nr:bark storage protein A-like [Cryptomeria japonica]
MAFHSSAFFLFLLIAFPLLSHAEISEEVAQKIKRINAKGEYHGLVVSGEAELKVVLAQGWFRPDQDLPTVDISARRFRVGDVQGCRTILAMTGSGSINAAQTTQLLLTHFRVKGVIHYGRGATAKPNDLSIGDIAIPRQFAHTGVWYWEKFGGDEGSFTREIANLTFSKYNVGEKRVNNKLQSVYFQPETLYSVKGTPEVGTAKFWFRVDDKLFATAQEIEDTLLDRCVGKSLICLEQQPKIQRVEKGSSANFYVNNEAYRDFLKTQLNIASLDTESAAIAMVCEGERKAFLAMRSITNYAGGSSEGNDASVIQQLWYFHARAAIVALFKKPAVGDSYVESVGVQIAADSLSYEGSNSRPNDLSIGDIAIPRQFAHTAVWYWEPETAYSVKGKPEVGNAKLWFRVDDKLFATAQEIEDTNLDKCLGKSLICFEEQPKIKRVEKGGSADFYVNNEAYRDSFLHDNLNIASLDTESAAIKYYNNTNY